MIYDSLLLLWLPLSIVSEDLSESQKCLFRCTADCLIQQKNNTVQQCLTECKAYDDPQLCISTDWSCWEVCKDLSPAATLEAVSGFELKQKDLATFLVFHPVEEATFYVVQYQLSNANLSSPQYEISLQPFITNQLRPKSLFCDPVIIRVAAVSSSGTGPFSKPFSLDAPRPIFNPRLELLTMVYLDTPYESGPYFDNGTVEVIFRYKVGAWALGLQDLDVTPMFHVIKCENSNLTTSEPIPDFRQGSLPGTVIGRIGSRMMYSKCQFIYYTAHTLSRQCQTSTQLRSPPVADMQQLTISCDNVRNSPCMHTPPICGRIGGIHHEVTEEYSAPGEKETSLSLNITFDPIVRKDEPPTVYYKAFYGEALPYPRQSEEALAGVNITRIIGNTTNCLKFDHLGYCLEDSNNSVSISGIRYDKTYGITFCAIKDPRNLMVPDLVGNRMILKPRASKIYVIPKRTVNVEVIIAVVGGAIILMTVIMAVCCYVNRKQKQKMYQL
ncbi:unnamed protein product [Cylicocyclus nassatus]|uniref:Uncharacterized protein n=1 Tax=Cylicocyclus nassatus TaxID=53992 RepID=A0AA36GE74_CYLNA|nr:unnamed protein product [Cylicocyclus nassatus]